ncbi:malonyl-ACP O-methyltransferase BioC [bacterium]|nr:malonyl-ACP O-methyltransferase BioC [bacterium]
MSTLVMNKNHIRRCFQKSQAAYDTHAIMQTRMADTLLNDLRHLPHNHFENILEIGCGTGLLTKRLAAQFRSRRYFANDLIAGSLNPGTRFNATRQHFLAGDIETMPALPDNLDLVVSNAAFQWLKNIQALLEKLALLIRPGGWLAFSTFGPENLKELAALTRLSLDYPALKEIKKMTAPWFNALAVSEEHHSLHFPDALSMLRHLRATGVNSLSKQIWSKSQLNKLLSQYALRFGSEKGVCLTYHPMYFILQRKKW